LGVEPEAMAVLTDTILCLILKREIFLVPPLFFVGLLSLQGDALFVEYN
jgi:hypothetical protein